MNIELHNRVVKANDYRISSAIRRTTLTDTVIVLSSRLSPIKSDIKWIVNDVVTNEATSEAIISLTSG